MKIEQLKARAEFWCDLLGVEDRWDVTLEVGNTGNMEGCAGLNHISAEHQISRIMVAPDEEEDTLVHEILHILFDGHKASEDYSPMHERAINKVAFALVELSKKKKKNGKQKSTQGVSRSVKAAGRKQPGKKRNSSTTSCSPSPVRVSQHAVPAGYQVCSGSLRD